jgi:hypothetical protein
MACNSTEFIARFPEFSNITPARIDVFIGDAKVILNTTTWGTVYELGVCYLTAHYLALSEDTLNGNVGNVGNVSSKGVDGTSVSYNTPSLSSIDQGYYLSTQYGQKFYTLLKSLGVMTYTV